MSRYLLTPRAEQDFREIARWYKEHRGTEAARKTIRNIIWDARRGTPELE